MPDPIFSLCYTSVRPQAVGEVIKRWVGRAASPENIELIICYDEGDTATKDAIDAAINHEPLPVRQVIVVANTGPKNCVSGWNTAAALSTGDIIVAITDDFDCPGNWDKALTDVNAPGWWTHECVVWIKDGYNADLFTLSILTRKRYERFGYLFYPGYQSLFCDTEYTYLAAQDRVVIDARHLLFEHMHPDCGKRPRDASDLKHASAERWKFGETLFNYRRSVGFPIDDGPNAAKWALIPVKYAVVVQAIRDDLCLEDVCRRIIDEGVRLRQTTELGDRIERLILFCPDQQWDGAPANPDGVREVELIAKRLNTWIADKYPGADIVAEFKPFRVRDVADTTKERIMIETGCRNWYQRYCLAKGYQHTIIMDGDELWKPGLIDRMNELVRERWPTSVFTGMIPVAGLPGYPIEGALDKATIYARADARFEMCRGAYGYRHELPGYDIYHFSATRKTIEEIARKHLGSGHADDPKYDMRGWVDNVLMKGALRPGMRNAHMYVQGPNVWPLVRAWTTAEWTELPASVKPYLGSPR